VTDVPIPKRLALLATAGLERIGPVRHEFIPHEIGDLHDQGLAWDLRFELGTSSIPFTLAVRIVSPHDLRDRCAVRHDPQRCSSLEASGPHHAIGSPGPACASTATRWPLDADDGDVGDFSRTYMTWKSGPGKALRYLQHDAAVVPSSVSLGSVGALWAPETWKMRRTGLLLIGLGVVPLLIAFPWLAANESIPLWWLAPGTVAFWWGVVLVLRRLGIILMIIGTAWTIGVTVALSR
jgi:hypothetical protein